MSAVPTLDWSFNPWREQPARAGVAALAAALAFVLVLGGTRSAFLALVLALGVAGTLAPAWMPVRCRVDESGIAVRGPFGWERRAWGDIRRAIPVAGGMLVSPFREARRMDRFRALVLPLPGVSRERLLRELEPRLAEHGLAHA